MVAYALARSSGVVSATPRVNAPQVAGLAASLASLAARNWMPNRCAIATAAGGPICSSSQTKYVLTERPNPVHMVRGPSIHSGLLLTGHHFPPQTPGVPGYGVTRGEGATNSVSSVLPASSAASIVNILNVDPAWYPVTLPPPATSWLTVFGYLVCAGGFGSRL